MSKPKIVKWTKVNGTTWEIFCDRCHEREKNCFTDANEIFCEILPIL